MNPAWDGMQWVFLLLPTALLLMCLWIWWNSQGSDGERSIVPLRLLALVVLVNLFVAMWYLPINRRPAPAAAGESLILVPWIAPAILVSVMVAIVAVRFWIRWDRAVSAANRKAKSGDMDGAIADLQAVLAAEPPTFLRLNALGNFLIGKERHAEALAAFDEALEIVRAQVTGPKVDHFTVCVLQNNRGASLYQLDRLEDGLEAYAAAQVSLDQVRADTKSVVGSDVTVDYLILDGRSRCLARLGRVEEATEAFRAADALFPKVIGRYGAEQKAMFRKNYEGTKALVKPESPGLGDDFA